MTQVVILILNSTGTSQFDMHGDATTDECASETRAHGTRRVNYGGGVQAAIATLENLISTLDGAASSARASAPCRPIVAPPTTPCDMRDRISEDELAPNRHRFRREARARGERVSLTEMSLMDLAREAAATDACDVMSQSMIRGDRLLHSERTSNKRKAHVHAMEAPSPIAPVMPPEVAELRARQERLTTAMKNLHLNLNLHNAAACAKKKLR
jgi:hypothetical protein